MEQEYFLTGYCRGSDQSRIVTVVVDRGELIEVDCSYETCPYAPGCQIAEKIREHLQ